jgi:CheY-like chemotaxis protein
VLVVEDNSTDRYAITIALERQNVSVIVAEDGAEALQWLKTQGFCAMVLDLIMPKVDGYGVIRYVVENVPDLPIVVVTGLRADELSGVDRRVVVDIMFKPYNAKALAERIAQICAERAPGASTK